MSFFWNLNKCIFADEEDIDGNEDSEQNAIVEEQDAIVEDPGADFLAEAREIRQLLVNNFN